MKHIQPRNEYLAIKATIKKQKPLGMITVEQGLLFAEWLADRYVKVHGGWMARFASEIKSPIYTTRELWELYQRFTGGKTTSKDIMGPTKTP
jgi:hypothetical protein